MARSAQLRFLVSSIIVVVGPASSAPPDTCSGESCVADNALSAEVVMELEQQARAALAGRDLVKAMDLFTAVLQKSDLAGSAGLKSDEQELMDAVTSARVHLGYIASNARDDSECHRHFEAGYVVGARALNCGFMQARPWPYDAAALPTAARRFVDRYAKCLLRSGRIEAMRQLYQAATAAGAFRNEWQCSVDLSPPDWALRAQPWWEVDAVGDGAKKLASQLQRQHTTIRNEALAILVERQAPAGVKVELNQEVNAARQGTWLELIAFDNGIERDSACAALPRTCKLLRRFLPSLHGRGHVKLSQVMGGTSAYPHCGPVDTKLRMHFTVSLPPNKRAEITVGGITRVWQDGGILVFDDSFQHVIEFDAEQDASRIILIVDLWHPDVPLEARVRSG